MPPLCARQSPNSNPPTTITFVVDSNRQFPVDIVWFDQAGKQIKYNRLVPGQSYTQQTYVGHMRAARDGDSCEYFEASTRFRRALIVPLNQ